MNERVRQEVGIHARLKHPAIVELITFFEDASYVYLVLELCHNGELASYLKNTEHAFTEGEARIIFEQVVSGVKYLHSHVFLPHRELTLANLMITSHKKVKIGDFGLVTQIQSASDDVTMCGTSNFISPEVSTSTLGMESNVWHLGCLLFMLLVGRPPFDTAGVRSTLTTQESLASRLWIQIGKLHLKYLQSEDTPRPNSEEHRIGILRKLGIRKKLEGECL